jgi:hypothetical protein
MNLDPLVTLSPGPSSNKQRLRNKWTKNGAWKIRSSHTYKRFKNGSLNINLCLKNTLITFVFHDKRFCVKFKGKIYIFKVVATSDREFVLLIDEKR